MATVAHLSDEIICRLTGGEIAARLQMHIGFATECSLIVVDSQFSRGRDGSPDQP